MTPQLLFFYFLSAYVKIAYTSNPDKIAITAGIPTPPLRFLLR